MTILDIVDLWIWQRSWSVVLEIIPGCNGLARGCVVRRLGRNKEKTGVGLYTNLDEFMG